MKVGVFTIQKNSLLYSLYFTVLLFVLQGGTAFAQFSANDPLARINTSATEVGNLVTTTSFVAVGLAFLFFFWNLATFILSSDNDSKESAKGKMGWSIIAIFVIVAIWGIVTFIGNIIGIDPTTPGGVIDLPAYNIP